MLCRCAVLSLAPSERIITALQEFSSIEQDAGKRGEQRCPDYKEKSPLLLVAAAVSVYRDRLEPEAVLARLRMLDAPRAARSRPLHKPGRGKTV